MNINIEIPDYDGETLDVVWDKDSEFTTTISLPN